METRDASTGARAPLVSLPSRQRAVLDAVVRYYRGTGEACPGSFVARRLNLHHSTVREHLAALHRKGWLKGPNSPGIPTRW
jgi:predicted transcriptional regulator